MTDFEKELIHYIFHVQDADDDNLSAEVICRKLYKYGLIDRGRSYWRPKKRPRYRWPARIIRKAEQTEPQTCDTCRYSYITCRFMDKGESCNYEPKTEPQTEDLQDWKDQMWAEAVIEPQTDCSWK